MRKFNCIVIMLALIGFSSICFVNADSLPNQEWVDITDEVFTNPANKSGWTNEKDSKVFRDANGMNLKIETKMFGVLLIDLENSKVFKLNEDKSKIEIEDKKLFQRDHGFSIVLRNNKMKIRIKMTEKPKGITSIGGIKAFN